jgi:3-methyl-2-oxobutanoate hydroxymethyltransferase
MITVNTLQKMKTEGEKIAMLTCYEASFASLMEAAGVDVLLVGDSLGMTVQGQAIDLARVAAGYVLPHRRRGARHNQTP